MSDTTDPVSQARRLWREGRAVDAGRLLFERIPDQDAPRWAAEILDFCRHRIGSLPAVDDVAAIARDPSRWPRAHAAFAVVRQLLLVAERDPAADRARIALLYLAENTAKVAYNASRPAPPYDAGHPAPFDEDTGWWIAENVRRIADHLRDPEFETESWDRLVAIPHAG